MVRPVRPEKVDRPYRAINITRGWVGIGSSEVSGGLSDRISKGRAQLSDARLCGKSGNFAGRALLGPGYAVSHGGSELEQVRKITSAKRGTRMGTAQFLNHHEGAPLARPSLNQLDNRI